MQDGLRSALGAAAAALARRVEEGTLPAVAITAAAAGEGATTAAAHLARDLSEVFGLRVLLLDLGGPGARLGAVLEADGAGALRRIADGELAGANARLALLESGPEVGPPGGLRQRLSGVLAAAAGRFDLVLVDAPALGEGFDALVAARACGHAVLVVRAGHLGEEPLRAARDSLAAAGVEVVGVILNARREVVPRWLGRLLR